MKKFPVDVLKLLSTFLESPSDKVKLSRCNRKYYEKLRNHIDCEKWNHCDSNEGISKAAFLGCKDLVDFFIAKREIEWQVQASTKSPEFLAYLAKVFWGWDSWLFSASKGGHRELVDFFIFKGANNWGLALAGAAKGAQHDLIDFFIKEKGCESWVLAEYGAMCGGHQELVNFFQEKKNKNI